MNSAPRNLLAALPSSRPEELVHALTPTGPVRIERIVSTGQCSPPGFWYDQHEAEWVMVLCGAGRIEYDDGTDELLASGDHTWIAPHRRHRVAWTSPDEPTVWLAVFYLL